MAPRANRGLSFFGMVGGVMAALKLKEHFDGYNKVATDEEGRVALHSPTQYHDRESGLHALEEERDGLLDTELPRPSRTRKAKRSCCVCCGLNCGLFWKAVGIVLALFLIVSAVKFAIWVFTPSPTGLEGLPGFGDFGTCSNTDAPHLWDGGNVEISIPVGDRLDHAIDTHGSGVGMITVTEAPADATEIQYKVTIRSNEPALLDEVGLQYPAANPDGTLDGTSRLLLSTPRLERGASSCVRYEVTMYVPKGVKKLHVRSHTPSHVQFDPHAQLELEDLFVTLFTVDKRNMIQPTENTRATKSAFEVYRGWIVGDASIGSSAAFTTQRGDGIINLRVHPTPPKDAENPETAALQTTTGAGRTDLYYISDKAFTHRPIKANHMSSKNMDLYLTYKEAEFSGNVKLGSASYSATGLQVYPPGTKWSHWVDEKDGRDEITVSSKGWTGLYV